MSEKDIYDSVQNAKQTEFADIMEPPRPLFREVHEGKPYPVHLMGEELAAVAQAITNKVQAPLAIAAQSVFAAATLAVQKTADVRLHTGQRRPVSEFFLTIADSGERKSSVDNEALRGSQEFEKFLFDNYREKQIRYEFEKEVWQSCRTEAIKKAKKDQTQNIEEHYQTLGPEPAPPSPPIVTCADPTIEGFHKLCEQTPRSLGIFSNEGGQFFGGYGMQDDTKIKTAAGLSDLWDGKPIKRVRSMTDLCAVSGRRVTIHLMAQSKIAAGFLHDELIENQGLLSRFLVVAPASLIGKRFFKAASEHDEKAIERFAGKMFRLLEKSEGDELCPTPDPLPLIALSERAKEKLIAYGDSIEQRLVEGGEYAAIKPLANKLPEHAARLAAVKTLFLNPEAKQIEEKETEESIQLAEFYASEAIRLLPMTRIEPDLLIANEIRKWLYNSWAENNVSTPDVYQFGPRCASTAVVARRGLNILEQHGWIIKIDGGAVIKGKKRREAWLIVREFSS